MPQQQQQQQLNKKQTKKLAFCIPWNFYSNYDTVTLQFPKINLPREFAGIMTTIDFRQSILPASIAEGN